MLMTTALMLGALMLGAGVAMFAAINIFLVLTAPDDDMLDEVDEEQAALFGFPIRINDDMDGDDNPIVLGDWSRP